MHVEILVECLFTSGGLLRIICRCCEIAREQVRISGFIYRLGGVGRVAREQVRVSGLGVDLAGLAELLVSK